MIITSVTIDLRNFTSFFNGLLDLKPDAQKRYLALIQEYLNLCIEDAKKISDGENIDFITTGDGIIVIFKDNLHFLRGFLYVISVNITLRNFFSRVNSDTNDKRTKNIGFGIGMDSGKAEVILLADNRKNYLSDALNISSRLEGLTKTFVSSNIIISSSSFWAVINFLKSKDLSEKYSTECYHSIMKLARAAESKFDREKSKELWDFMTDINESLFFRYLSGVSLKGLNEPKVVYNFSKTLFKINFLNFLNEHEQKLRDTLKENYQFFIDKMNYL